VRALLVIVVTICAVILGANDVRAQKRVALVIGNSDYTTIPSLRNPGSDARLMADSLRDLGFDVMLETDMDRSQMARTIREFGKRLSKAGPDTAGLFYYAGHGVQARGTNYLVPLRAPIEDELDLTVEAIDVSWVLNQMQAAGNKLNFVVLDACRNNPFKGMSRSAGRGLARIDSARGALVAFAAAPGQVAADGTGENSPYTSALAAAMRTPGLPVEQVFKKVRISVESQTGGRQTPWEESSLRGDFYFVPKPAATADQSASPVLSQPNSDTGQPGAGSFALERTFWESVKDSGDPEIIKTYLERYPNGVFSKLARVMIDRLEPDTAALNVPQEPRSQSVNPEATAVQSEQQVAAIAPQTPSEPEPEDAPDLPRKIQQVLDAAGCRPGPIDGVWGRNSDAALKRFSRYAKLDPAAQGATVDTLARLLEHKGSICPLTCGTGQVLNAAGKCKPRKPRTATPAKPTVTHKQPAAAPVQNAPSQTQGKGWQIGR